MWPGRQRHAPFPGGGPLPMGPPDCLVQSRASWRVNHSLPPIGLVGSGGISPPENLFTPPSPGPDDPGAQGGRSIARPPWRSLSLPLDRPAWLSLLAARMRQAPVLPGFPAGPQAALACPRTFRPRAGQDAVLHLPGLHRGRLRPMGCCRVVPGRLPARRVFTPGPSAGRPAPGGAGASGTASGRFPQGPRARTPSATLGKGPPAPANVSGVPPRLHAAAGG